MNHVRCLQPQMKAGEVRYLLLPIVPVIEIGFLNVKISAYGPVRHDLEEIKIEVVVSCISRPFNKLHQHLAKSPKAFCSFQYDGVQNDDFIPYILDLVNQGSQLIPDFSTNIPERFVKPGERDFLYIPGSNVAHMRIHGANLFHQS